MQRKTLCELSFRFLLSLGLAACVWFAAGQAVGAWYFHRRTPEDIRRAIQWDRGNPDYYAELARTLQYSFPGGDPGEVVSLYEKATSLSPYGATYWVELGAAYEWAGRQEAALRALERARALFPNSPDINWQLGNFYIRAGRTREGLRALAMTVRGDPRMRWPAFDLAWRATGDIRLILAEMVPPQADVFFHLLNYLIETQRVDAAQEVWTRLLKLGLRFQPEQGFPYLDSLLRNRQVDALAAAWAALAERHPTRIRQPGSGANLITNGDFESEILNGGLDWRVTAVEGVKVQVDRVTYFDGTRALMISFDGRHNVNYHHVLQYVVVRPNTPYLFQGYARSQGITTDSGPRFQIQDAYDPSRLSLSTPSVVGRQNWFPQQLAFRTGPDTRLLVVRLARPPSAKFDSRIAGTVVIDRIVLQEVD